MEEPSRLFSMDVHRLFRAFIPGLISILAFFPFYCSIQNVDNITSINEVGAILIVLVFAYIIGTLLEWTSQTILYRFSQCIAYCTIPCIRYELLYREVKGLNNISKKKLKIKNRTKETTCNAY